MKERTAEVCVRYEVVWRMCVESREREAERVIQSKLVTMSDNNDIDNNIIISQISN